MSYTEFNIHIGLKTKSISIESMEPVDWNPKWSGLIRCVDENGEGPFSGLYMYIPVLPEEAPDVLSVAKEQMKIDVVAQSMGDHFKIHVTIQDLKSLRAIKAELMTTSNSMKKYSEMTSENNVTCIFIRTGSFIFHSTMRLKDLDILSSCFSKLQ